MSEQSAQAGAPAAAPGQAQTPEAPRIVRVPPIGAPGHDAAEAALAKLAGSPGDQEASGAPAGEKPAPIGEQSAVADPVQAMNAGRELAAGLQDASEIAGLDKGTAEFYSKHLGEALQRPPVTQAASAQAAAETRQMLQQAYGGKAEQMIQDARAELAELTKRLPDLPNWLEHTGAGNDAGIVIRLAQRHQERQRARVFAGARRR